MANILPENELLQEILEDTSVSFSFQSQLSEGEVLKTLEITYHNFPVYILVNGPTFSGKFSDLFELSKNSLKYRQGLDYGTASKFSELPMKGSADLYSIIMPGEMIKYFDITVMMTYEDSTAVMNTIIKKYRQPVRGNRQKFISQFLNYVR